MDNTKPISLNVPEELRKSIDEVARAKMLSRSAWIRTTLAEQVAEQLPKPAIAAPEPAATN